MKVYPSNDDTIRSTARFTFTIQSDYPADRFMDMDGECFAGSTTTELIEFLNKIVKESGNDLDVILHEMDLPYNGTTLEIDVELI